MTKFSRLSALSLRISQQVKTNFLAKLILPMYNQHRPQLFDALNAETTNKDGIDMN